MKQSKLFTKTQKFAPKDEISKNAQLLIRAGFAHKEMAGVYSFLPLGLRVIEKISEIIKVEMDAIGGMQMKNSALQVQNVWEKTNRWDDAVVDNWFKTELKNGTKVGLAFTHEEAMTNLMKNFISSYKDLPAYPYDIRTMFRNETRAKSGLMRGREFYWKALYSFSIDEAQHNEFYERAKKSYQKIYKNVGLGAKTYLTFASGGTFSKYSHEFQTISEAGEDIIYVDEEKNIAINKEVLTDEVLSDLNVNKDNLKETKAIEVGNIFSLGTKFSEPIGLTYKNKDGKEKKVFMGSYGIGIGRLMGTIVEVFADDKGIVWPESVAPFKIHLLVLGTQSVVRSQADELYRKLQEAGVEVLYDERDIQPGQKFADADLIGIPCRVVISERSLKDGGVELKKRNEEKGKIVKIKNLLENKKYARNNN